VKRLKPTTIALLAFGLVFAGVLAALQVDRWLRSRAPQTVILGDRSGVLLANNTGPVPAAPFDFRAAAKRIMPTVVSIDAIIERETFMGERFLQNASSGSGVVISKEGHIITNSHVVRDPQSPTRTASQFRVTFSDGKVLDAKPVGIDVRSDLAVLKVDSTTLVPAELGDSSLLEIGEWVIAVGNPLGYSNTLSVGVVSSLNRETMGDSANTMFDAIQTDAAINQGNSGGALCNSKGELVGINTAIASIGGGNIGIGFAIPVNRVKMVVKDILEFGYVRYAGLGLEFHPRPQLLQIPQARAELQQMTGATSEPPSEGLLVNSVFQGTAAAQAGLNRYDVVVSIDGTKMSDLAGYNKFIIGKKPGDKVKLRVWSKGESKDVTVTLMDVGRNN